MKMRIFDFIFFRHSSRKVVALRDAVINGRKKDIRGLKKINRKFKLAVQGGSIEVTIKNLSGILEELK
jgi:hypothetical protein